MCLLTVNDNWYHFANVTVREVRPGVRALDGGLVLTTLGVNTSRTLPLADLPAYKVTTRSRRRCSLANGRRPTGHVRISVRELFWNVSRVEATIIA